MTSVAADGLRVEEDVIPEAQKLSWQRIAFFTFICTSAGPFGIEDAMQSGGPGVALLLVTFIPLCFMTPMCMMIQELAEWMPTNHGAIRWVRRAWGKRIGFVNAMVQVFVNLVDLGVYPVLVSDYVFGHFAPDASFGAKYALRLAVGLGCGSLCLFNISKIAIITAAITMVIVFSFLVGSFIALPEAVQQPHLWVQTVPHMRFGSIFSIGLWMYSGFLGSGSLSGEVRKGALFKGQVIALGLGWFMYVLPICAVMHVQPNWSKWDAGYLGTAFGQVRPALGTVVALAGMSSGMGLFMTNLSCYCRTIWGVADIGWLPAPLRRKNRFNVPWVAVTVQLVVTSILSLFSFDFLINIEFCFATFMYLMFATSFLRLRWTEPDAERGFRVPGTNLTAMLLATPMCVFVGGAFGATIVDWRIALIFIGFVAVAFTIYLTVVRPKERALQRVAHAVLDEEGKTRLEVVRAPRDYLDA
jgi:amino acid transporter